MALLGENASGLPEGVAQRPSAHVAALRFSIDSGYERTTDEIAQELSLVVLANGIACACLTCSPWELESVAVGALAHKGNVRERAEVESVRCDATAGEAHVELALDKNDLLSRIDQARGTLCVVPDPPLVTNASLMIDPKRALDLMEVALTRSTAFARTGGVHCGLVADNARMYAFHEDVGRNNVLDRIFGQSILEGVALDDKMVVFSGRVSGDVVRKIATMGVPVLVSHSAPTSLGIELANKLGVTVVAFARHGQRCTVYTHPEHVAGANA